MPLTQFDLKTYIREVPDFPKKGINFKDITPLLADAEAFARAVQGLAQAGRTPAVQKIVAIESRGFIFGSAVAQALGVGVVPVRKKGKLPGRTLSASYQLEYGWDTLEMHHDALAAGERALVVDDVLATGGTAAAVIDLVRQTGAEPAGAAFLIELEFLNGRQKLGALPVHTLVRY